MNSKKALDTFNDLVLNKYKIYNSLFMSLPYEKISNIGMLIPILNEISRSGLANGNSPVEIIESFFSRHTDFSIEEEKNDFLFRIIQYIERQVVLFDSVEDAAFPDIIGLTDNSNFEEFYHLAKARGKEAELKKKLSDFEVRLVFTAHPTQFYPASVQNILHDLREAITRNSLKDINILLQQLGKTPFINLVKPTPLDEAKNIISYLRHVFYDAVGDLYTNLKLSIDESTFHNPSIIQLGFWPGGDRDGNPFVTAKITRKVADALRLELMKCYYNHLKVLRRRLTFRKVEAGLEALSQLLYKTMFSRHAEISVTQILTPLYAARKVLVEDHNGLFVEMLDDFIDRVNIFKTHFATLDIRQDSPVHDRVIRQVAERYKLIDKPFDQLTEDERIQLLTKTEVLADENDFDDPVVSDTIKNIKQIKELQRINGEQGANRYIISNSEDIFAVLNVFGLFRFCGLKEEEISVDIIPLFETIKGLNGSEKTMSQLYNFGPYKAHLQNRNNKQTIMLGFSDGTKDGGYVKANWEIFNTKEVLSKVSEKNQVTVVFFDGRGGPPARGGGKTHRFYASQGKQIANNAIQLTIQGQTITSLYGTNNQFRFNVEQLIMAGLSNHIFVNLKTDVSRKERKLLDELATKSYEKYEELKLHPKFLPYLEKMSTMKYYGRAKIGSRPGKRGTKAKLELSDLRAITFVGAWSQLKQNVPGYYGIGTSILHLKNQGRIDEVKALFKNVAFFKTLILNSMMSLTKTFFPLTAYMKENPAFGSFWEILYNEYELSKQMMLEISGYETLMEEELMSKTSIQIREEIVLPLLTIQQYALQKIEKNDAHKSTYEAMVTRSLFGNINASRNSA